VAASLARDADGSDRMGLVAMLFAASALVGAAAGALLPRSQASGADVK
jgi:hypothetical protein